MDDQLGLVERRVDLRVLTERRDGCGHDVGEVSQREPLLLLECALARVAVGDDARHVRLLRLPGVRDRGLGPGHVFGDQPAHAR